MGNNMNPGSVRLAIALSLSLAFCCAGFARDYFVSPRGDDGGSGTSDSPWKSLAKAARAGMAGDTIYVRAGRYRERLLPANSGREGAYVSFRAYPGETAIIDGDGLAIAWGGLIETSGLDYILVSGFSIVNASDAGIMMNEGDHLVIEDNRITNCRSSGIRTWKGGDLVISGNVIEAACVDDPYDVEVISLRTIENFEISRNLVLRGKGIAIDAAAGCRRGRIFQNEVQGQQGLGFYVDAWDEHLAGVEVYDNLSHDNYDGFCVNSENGGLAEGVKVYRNVAYRNRNRGFAVGWGGIGLKSGRPCPLRDLEFTGNASFWNGAEGFVVYCVDNAHLENIRFSNNLSFGNKGAGFLLSGGDDKAVFSVERLQVVNNTLYGNGSKANWGSGGIFIGTSANKAAVMVDIVIRNNIVSGNCAFSIAVWPWGKAPDGVVIDHNLVDGYRGLSREFGETLGEHCQRTAPSFVDAEHGDFHLQKDSAAIDRGGSDGAPEVDFDGMQRPRGQGCDIGAFEF